MRRRNRDDVGIKGHANSKLSAKFYNNDVSVVREGIASEERVINNYKSLYKDAGT